MEPGKETLNHALGDDFDPAEARHLGRIEQV
jgi:hypothetical protein